MKPAPLRRSADAPPETLGHRAYERLCDMITAGALTPGATLSLREVAGALDISMTPVREAVSRLAAAGALVIKPGRAAAVPQMDLARFRDLTETRREIEGYAAALAARRRSEAQLAEIERAEAEFRRLDGDNPAELARATRLNHEFHFAVYRAAGSRSLLNIIRGLWLQIGPVLNYDLSTNPERVKSGAPAGAHADMLACIAGRDESGARQALNQDIAAAASFIETNGRLAGDASESE